MILAIVSFILGILRGRFAFAPYRTQEDLPLDVVGIVQTVRSSQSGLSFVMQTKDARIRVWTDVQDVREGDQVRVCGMGEVPQPPANPGGFDTLIYDGARGVKWELKAEEIEILSRGHRPYVFRYLFLSRIRSTLESLLPKEQEGAILAILAGDRSDMDAGMTEAFQDCGIAHIIAVSGLHVQVLCTMLEWCLGKIMARKKALAVTGGCVWGYCFLTGGAVSTIRAAMMLTLRFGAVLCGRKEDPLNSLGLSALCVLLWRPLYLFDAAFQLSFMATLALFVARRPWLRCYRIPMKLRRSLATALAVVTWSAPVTLLHFHQISLYAVLLNLLVVPLMSIVILASLGAVLLSHFSADLARFLVGCVYYVLVFYREGCGLMLRWRGGILRLGAMPGSAVLLYYTLYILWIIPIRVRKIRFLHIGCFVLFCVILCLHHLQTQALFLSIGQGDCMLLRSRGRAYIIDAGPGYDRCLKPCLEYYGIRQIDGVFVTHMDKDHSEGVLRLLTDPDFNVQALYLPDHPVHDFHELLWVSSAEVHWLSKGEQLHLSGIDIRVLSPDPSETYIDENSGSLCLQARTKHGTICCMGDADQDTEQRILTAGLDVRCTVLKVGHHGSRTSSSEAFLTAAAPQAAWISCKKNNSYGHPHQEVLKRLRACGIQPVISYETGCLIMDEDLYTYQEAFRKRWMQ